MESIDEDYMTVPTPFSPYEKIEEPLLQLTDSQTEASPTSPGKGTPATLCKPCQNQRNTTLATVVRDLLRGNLLDCLKTPRKL